MTQTENPTALPTLAPYTSCIASTPVTARLVPAATDDALDLLLDDGEAQARATAAPLPKRLSESSPSASEAEEQFDVKPTSPITPRTEEQAPVKAGMGEKASGPPTCNALVGGRQEGESSRVGKLRWQLWHKGKVSTGLGKGAPWGALC